ncbi:Polyketide cyclase / dehydrase and lipid transport [Mycobacteroides abscessus subsp. abscessus]|nr:Polyketide cyclase / dehydrase and lipid transport [Mycobacteroides abscessus subsp. abscessus]
METIEVRRSIAAPIADVFDWISNAGNYTDSPLFLAAKLIRSGSAAAYGAGAIRRFTFPFAVVHEEITRFDPPYSFSYRVVKCMPPVRHEGGAVVLTPPTARISCGRRVPSFGCRSLRHKQRERYCQDCSAVHSPRSSMPRNPRWR